MDIPLLPLTLTNQEEFFTLVYRYYKLRGFKHIVSIKVSNLITTIFLLFVIIFMTTYVNYKSLFASYKLEEAIDWSRPMHWLLIVYMIFYVGYWLWKLSKTIYDLKKMWTVHKFYRDQLEIDTFKLQNTNWEVIQNQIVQLDQYQGRYTSDNIVQLIVRREDFSLGLIRQLLKYYDWISVSKILEWELNFIVFTYLFDSNFHRLKPRDQINIDKIKKRLKIIGILNIIFIPFLLILSGVYIVFRYGEIIYTKSKYVTPREWSKWARYTKIRQYSELPHNYEHRLYHAKKYADKYISYFRPSLIYNLVQLILIILGIVFVVFIILITINFNFLLKFELWGKSCSQYLSILFTTILVLKSYLNKYTKVIGSQEKTQQHLSKALHILQIPLETTEWSIGQFHSREVCKGFSSKWYYHRIKIILVELWGIIQLPYLFLRTIPEFTESLVEFLYNNTMEGENDIGDILVPGNLLIHTI